MIDNSTEVVIESSRDLDEDDLEILTMVFQKRKQYGGGDIISFSSIDSKSFKLTYEDFETKQRILSGRYFFFNDIYLRSSEFGYRNEPYDTLKSKLVLRNLEANLNIKSNYLLIELYAEHLAPDNEVVEIQQSILFPNTFYITYKEDNDKENLLVRYNKKSNVKDRIIEIVDALNTNSFLIKPANADDAINIGLIKNEIVDHILNLKLKSKYFIDENDSYVLFQFEAKEDAESLPEADRPINKLIDSIQNFLKNNKLVLEYCYNFSLLSEFKNADKSQKSKKNANKVDKTCQTDSTPAQSKTTRSANNERNGDVLYYDSSNELSKILKAEKPGKLYLNDKEPLGVGLINSTQLCLNLIAELNKIKSTLRIRKIDERTTNLVVKYSDTNRAQVINKLKHFYENEFLFKVIRIPKSIINSPELTEKFMEFHNTISSKFTAIYFVIKDDEILAYGPLKPLTKTSTKIEYFLDFLNANNTFEGSKKYEKFITTERSQELLDKSARKKQERKLKRIEEKEKKINNALIENSENTTIDIIYTAFTPVSELRYEEPDALENDNVIVINDAAEGRLLSRCLIECHKVYLDFKKGLNEISPDISLALIKNEDEEKNERVFVVTARPNTQEIKNKINKLIIDYEYGYLKQSSFDLGQNLKHKEIFNDLLIDLKAKKGVEDLNKILLDLYASNRVVCALIYDKTKFEVYGYTKAVENVEDYIKQVSNKVVLRFCNELRKRLDFKVKYKKKYNLDVKYATFNRFDGIYFDDLNRQLKKLDAKAVKLNGDKAIEFSCTNDELRNFDRKTFDQLEEISKWKSRVEEFLKLYVYNFDFEIIQTPFSRNDEKAKNFLYDRNSLDIVWTTDDKLEVFGLKTEIYKLKQTIEKMGSSLVVSF